MLKRTMAAKPRTVTLQEAAQQLGLHYMTVYRYVRTGKLPATQDGLIWRIRASDVNALKNRRVTAKGSRSRHTTTTGTSRALEGALSRWGRRWCMVVDRESPRWWPRPHWRPHYAPRPGASIHRSEMGRRRCQRRRRASSDRRVSTHHRSPRTRVRATGPKSWHRHRCCSGGRSAHTARGHGG